MSHRVSTRLPFCSSFGRFATVLGVVAVVVSSVSLCPGAYTLLPWSTNNDPSDSNKSASVTATTSSYQYSVVQGGTMDGTNTRMPSAQWPSQDVPMVWESNRTVRMENMGTTNVVNPWLSNGHNNFRNLAEIVSVPSLQATDREKCLALWYQHQNQVRHMEEGDAAEDYPVLDYNSIGYSTCGASSIKNEKMWVQMGYQWRRFICRATPSPR